MTTEAEKTVEQEVQIPENQFLGMSDEDFLKAAPPVIEPASVEQPQKTAEELAAEAAAREAAPAATAAATSEAAQETEEEKKAKEEAAKNAAVADPAGAAKPAAEVDGGKVDDGKTTKDEKKPEEAKPTPAAADPKAAQPSQEKKPEAAKTDAEKAAEAAKSAAPVPPKPEELQAFYSSLIGTPIKANGKTITLKSPEEVLRLVQMGAGYGRKIQDLQPHLKTIRMLEKNEMLDENKLSFAIDLINKNPEAIKKLIKESNIDPLDLNNGDNVYIPPNRSVSDKEMAFTTAIADVRASESGLETLKVIDQKWDQDSKNLLFEKPELLGIIQSQRENGIYDQIATEVERRKTLGQIAPSTSFLDAYHAVGGEMMKANAFKLPEEVKTIQPQPVVTPQPQPIATTVAAPKAPANSDKVAAAAPTKLVDKTQKPASTVNPLSLPDDEFMKTFSGRL